MFVFDHPANPGKTFALAIQSVGMVSASIYILSQRRKVEWRVLKYALFGSVIATPFGIFVIVPYLADLWVKVLFSILYGSFGLLPVLQLKSIMRSGHAARPASSWPTAFWS